MRDYVRVTKPTPAQLWWARHGEQVQAAVFILAIAIVGSLGV